jgi:hypothetical protein
VPKDDPIEQRAGPRSLGEPRHPRATWWAPGPSPSRESNSSSISMRSISSTNSGFPSLTVAMRSRTSRGRPLEPRRWSISSAHSCSVRGESEIVVAFILPPAHTGRSSSKSGRAMHSSRIDAPRDQSERCSMRSRKADSPQWTSSNTTTTGRARPRVSRKRRIAQKVSSGAPPSPAPSSFDRFAVISPSCSSSASAAWIASRTAVSLSKSPSPRVSFRASTTGK